MEVGHCLLALAIEVGIGFYWLNRCILAPIRLRKALAEAAQDKGKGKAKGKAQRAVQAHTSAQAHTSCPQCEQYEKDVMKSESDWLDLRADYEAEKERADNLWAVAQSLQTNGRRRKYIKMKRPVRRVKMLNERWTS